MKTKTKFTGFLTLTACLLAYSTTQSHAQSDEVPATTERVVENTVKPEVADINVEVLSDTARAALAEKTATEIEKNPEMACELTKEAVANVDEKSVAAIVKAAGTRVPDKLQLIAQCAIAQVPTAAEQITAAVDELLKNTPSKEGDIESAKSAKSAKDEAANNNNDVADGTDSQANPLDFPTGGNPKLEGSAGGQIFMPVFVPKTQVVTPNQVPNVISPPPVTQINPPASTPGPQLNN